ncbi:MAG TPA: hypothetical protein VMM18_04090 [Gemmatimonadaceae bacterium]|nr:hypothetical protein [Gemmatimonadaceae bacterium]
MIAAIIAILAGLVLLADLFRGAGERVVGALRPFAVVIGVVAIVVGILEITSVIGVALLLAGFILAASALEAIPGVGDQLAQAGRALAAVRVVIGIIVLVLGIVTFVRTLDRPGGRRGPPPGVPPTRGAVGQDRAVGREWTNAPTAGRAATIQSSPRRSRSAA